MKNRLRIEIKELLLTEMRIFRCKFAKIFIWMKTLCLFEQLRFGLSVIWIRHTAIDRTNSSTLLLICASHALGALFRNDVVVIIRQRIECLSIELVRCSRRINCCVWALRLACATVNALFGYLSCHNSISYVKN